ncbi:MAG: AI-2E family transporter [Armatimonadetes bacterium]|nr:AI-2E family transporter [Candidatus Hippobium faecium]
MSKKLVNSALVVISVILFICLAIYFYGGVFAIIFALMFGTILNAPISYLERFHIPRWLGLIICLFIVVGFVVDINLLVIPKAVPEFSKLTSNLPDIVSKWDNSLSDYFASMEVDDFFGFTYSEFKVRAKKNLISNSGSYLQKFREIGAYNIEYFSEFLLSILMGIYVALDPKTLERGFLDPWNRKIRYRLRRCMLRIEKMLFSWAIGLCCGCMCIFLLTWLGLSIVKMPFAFFFASFAGFANIIPAIGPIISAILPCAITLVTEPKMTVYVLVIYIFVQFVESNFLTPLIMKKQLSIHPMILIFSIVSMGYVCGVVGCFITAPIVASIGIMYEELYARPRRYKPGSSTLSPS